MVSAEKQWLVISDQWSVVSDQWLDRQGSVVNFPGHQEEGGFMVEKQRTSIRSYRDLKVWQRSMDLTVRTYELTRRFPAEEKYGLISQMRRAAASAPANIAEGQARRSKKEFLQMLGIARGSLAELETFVTLSERLSLIQSETSDSLLKECAELNRMMNGLMRALSNRE